MDGSEIRDSIGLQYFAENGNTSDTGADMDGFDESEFLAALEGSDAEDQRGTNEGNEENVQDGAEDQRAEEQPEEPENQPSEDAKYRRRRWNSRYRPCRSSTTDSRSCCRQTQCRR